MDYNKIFHESLLQESLQRLMEEVETMEATDWSKVPEEERKEYLEEQLTKISNNLYQVHAKLDEMNELLKDKNTPPAKAIRERIIKMSNIMEEINVLLSKPSIKELYENVQVDDDIKNEVEKNRMRNNASNPSSDNNGEDDEKGKFSIKNMFQSTKEKALQAWKNAMKNQQQHGDSSSQNSNENDDLNQSGNGGK